MICNLCLITSEWAGSVDTTKVRNPLSLNCNAIAGRHTTSKISENLIMSLKLRLVAPELEVVFPTPPFPPTKTNLGLAGTVNCFIAEFVKLLDDIIFMVYGRSVHFLLAKLFPVAHLLLQTKQWIKYVMMVKQHYKNLQLWINIPPIINRGLKRKPRSKLKWNYIMQHHGLKYEK